jgi:hypothetical protein
MTSERGCKSTLRVIDRLRISKYKLDTDYRGVLRAESDKPRIRFRAFSEGRLIKASKRPGRVKGKLRLNDFHDDEDHECGGLCDIPDITERDDM